MDFLKLIKYFFITSLSAFFFFSLYHSLSKNEIRTSNNLISKQLMPIPSFSLYHSLSKNEIRTSNNLISKELKSTPSKLKLKKISIRFGDTVVFKEGFFKGCPIVILGKTSLSFNSTFYTGHIVECNNQFWYQEVKINKREFIENKWKKQEKEEKNE